MPPAARISDAHLCYLSSSLGLLHRFLETLVRPPLLARAPGPANARCRVLPFMLHQLQQGAVCLDTGACERPGASAGRSRLRASSMLSMHLFVRRARARRRLRNLASCRITHNGREAAAHPATCAKGRQQNMGCWIRLMHIRAPGFLWCALRVVPRPMRAAARRAGLPQ